MIAAAVLSTAWFAGLVQGQPAERAQVTLHASTLKPYAGQEVDLWLDLDIPEALAKKPMQLDIPWLAAEFGWSLPPEEWLCRQSVPGQGLPLAINGRSAWLKPAREDKGGRLYRLAWKLIPDRAAPLLQGRIEFEPVVLTVDQVTTKSNSLALTVQPLPLPPRDFPSIHLGVGDYQMTAQPVEPSALVLGEEAILTLKVSGQGPLALVPRPALQRLPEFRRDFLITQGTETWSEDGTARFFRYHLRPVRTGLAGVPRIAFGYFDPKGGAYQIGTTTAVPLKVQPKEAVVVRTPPYPPGMQPERLQLAPPSNSLLRKESVWPIGWIVFVLVVPPLVWGGLWLWKSQRLPWQKADHSLSLAAREALELLHRTSAPSAGERAERLTDIIAGYLHERFDLNIVEPTPADVEKPLEKAGIPPASVAVLREFLDVSAAARFGTMNGSDGKKLSDLAVQVIRKLEEPDWAS